MKVVRPTDSASYSTCRCTVDALAAAQVMLAILIPARGVVKVPGEIALGLHHADVGPAGGLLED